MKTSPSYINGVFATSAGEVSKVSIRLTFPDLLGTVKVRWGINRSNYMVKPGLYAVGDPGSDSDVLVTANYKLSFDTLRKNLNGRNAWIMVLDTKGVNVWCAAGKGTFGTKELVNRVGKVSLDKIIRHKRLILPQLGAVGVSAHKVKEETGFTVMFGPVRAADIPAFIESGYKATQEMRRVTFTLWDRMKLIPNDFFYGKYLLLGAFAVLFLLTGLDRSGYSIRQALDNGLWSGFNIFMGYVAGIVITPTLLPYIPVRRFAFKGLIAGIAVSFLLLAFHKLGDNWLEIISWFLLISAVSSFVAMNFTGSSTYTSLSGVKKEMKIAVPVQIALSAIGLILSVIGRIV